MARKQAQIERYKQEQAQKQTEQAVETHPADDITDYVDEQFEEAGQGELLEY